MTVLDAERTGFMPEPQLQTSEQQAPSRMRRIAEYTLAGAGLTFAVAVGYLGASRTAESYDNGPVAAANVEYQCALHFADVQNTAVRSDQPKISADYEEVCDGVDTTKFPFMESTFRGLEAFKDGTLVGYPEGKITYRAPVDMANDTYSHLENVKAGKTGEVVGALGKYAAGTVAAEVGVAAAVAVALKRRRAKAANAPEEVVTADGNEEGQKTSWWKRNKHNAFEIGEDKIPNDRKSRREARKAKKGNDTPDQTSNEDTRVYAAQSADMFGSQS